MLLNSIPNAYSAKGNFALKGYGNKTGAQQAFEWQVLRSILCFKLTALSGRSTSFMLLERF